MGALEPAARAYPRARRQWQRCRRSPPARACQHVRSVSTAPRRLRLVATYAASVQVALLVAPDAFPSNGHGLAGA
eukprot:567443-Rhodomonas_salina.1